MKGFIGAFFLTMVFSFYFPALLAQFSWLVCPADGYVYSHDCSIHFLRTVGKKVYLLFIDYIINMPYVCICRLYIWPFPPSLTCEPNPVFILTKMNLPYIGEATLYPIQLHGIKKKNAYSNTYTYTHSCIRKFRQSYATFNTFLDHAQPLLFM